MALPTAVSTQYDEDTTAEDFYTSLKKFTPISADDLCSQAALLKRVDRKYMLTISQTVRLLEALRQSGARVLEIDGKRLFHYLSDYFDTDNFDLYRAAATKRRRRYKVRERFYCDSGEHFVEVKIRDGRNHNVKKRLRCPNVSPASISSEHIDANTPYTFSFSGTDAGQWIAHTLAEHNNMSLDQALEAVDTLHPRARTSYSRSTLLLPDGARLTCDSDVRTSSLSAGTDATGTCPTQAQVPFVIVETKSTLKPSCADRLLWSWSVRPVKISKYAFAIATHYGQKANKWTRALKLIEDASEPHGSTQTM